MKIARTSTNSRHGIVTPAICSTVQLGSEQETPALCYTVGSHDAIINDWATPVHTAHIMHTAMNMQSGQGPSDATMQGMTTSLATLTETTTASYMLAAVREEKRKTDLRNWVHTTIR
jgi:hypothetical protein